MGYGTVAYPVVTVYEHNIHSPRMCMHVLSTTIAPMRPNDVLWSGHLVAGQSRERV